MTIFTKYNYNKPMNKIKLFLFIAVLLNISVIKSQTLYAVKDSCMIEHILDDSDTSINITATAELFSGRPYVAGTLDREETELLTVNTREMDCTTFVETVAAIVTTARKGEKDFHSFCDNLRTLRYRNGICNDYADRLHYISQWVAENTKNRLIEEVFTKQHTGVQRLHLHYMSKNPQRYKQLKESPRLVEKIRTHEMPFRDIAIKYIPKNLLRDGVSERDIRDGDIIALVTAIEGLDVTHIGFAKWVNGELHLLHASSSAKKVIVEPRSLHDYMSDKNNHLGIRVFRIID